MEQIVKLGPQHCEQLALLNQQLIEDEGHRNTMSLQEITERMRRWLQTDYSCYGIRDNSDDVMCYCLYSDDGEYYYIRQLFTQRQARRRGLATRLLDHLQANELADKAIRLEVLIGNEQAKTFYLNKGFRVYCETLEKE